MLYPGTPIRKRISIPILNMVCAIRAQCVPVCVSISVCVCVCVHPNYVTQQTTTAQHTHIHMRLVYS